MAPLPFRLPLRALPLAIRVVRAARRALERLHDDLASLVEPETVDDLVSWDSLMDQHEQRFAEKWRPRVCVDCGTSDDAGMCDSCAVLNTGRLPS